MYLPILFLLNNAVWGDADMDEYFHACLLGNVSTRVVRK